MDLLQDRCLDDACGPCFGLVEDYLVGTENSIIHCAILSLNSAVVGFKIAFNTTKVARRIPLEQTSSNISYIH